MKRIASLDEYIISFRTLNINDFHDKEFKYKYDNDKNGICYFIGTNYGESKRWINPAKSNKIKLRSSGWYFGDINCILGRKSVYSFSSCVENAFVIIDFGPKIRIKATHYTLQHYKFNDNYLRSWKVFGSRNGQKWDMISIHNGSVRHKPIAPEFRLSPFQYAGHSITFKINHCINYYHMFKIQMIGTNSYDNYHFCCNSFEIYGFLMGNK